MSIIFNVPMYIFLRALLTHLPAVQAGKRCFNKIIELLLGNLKFVVLVKLAIEFNTISTFAVWYGFKSWYLVLVEDIKIFGF